MRTVLLPAAICCVHNAVQRKQPLVCCGRGDCRSNARLVQLTIASGARCRPRGSKLGCPPAARQRLLQRQTAGALPAAAGRWRPGPCCRPGARVPDHGPVRPCCRRCRSSERRTQEWARSRAPAPRPPGGPVAAAKAAACDAGGQQGRGAPLITLASAARISKASPRTPPPAFPPRLPPAAPSPPPRRLSGSPARAGSAPAGRAVAAAANGRAVGGPAGVQLGRRPVVGVAVAGGLARGPGPGLAGERGAGGGNLGCSPPGRGLRARASRCCAPAGRLVAVVAGRPPAAGAPRARHLPSTPVVPAFITSFHTLPRPAPAPQLPKPKWVDRGLKAKALLMSSPPGLWFRRVAVAAHLSLIVRCGRPPAGLLCAAWKLPVPAAKPLLAQPPRGPASCCLPCRPAAAIWRAAAHRPPLPALPPSHPAGRSGATCLLPARSAPCCARCGAPSPPESASAGRSLSPPLPPPAPWCPPRRPPATAGMWVLPTSPSSSGPLRRMAARLAPPTGSP